MTGLCQCSFFQIYTPNHLPSDPNRSRILRGPLDHGAEGELAVRRQAPQKSHRREDVLAEAHDARAALPDGKTRGVYGNPRCGNGGIG